MVDQDRRGEALPCARPPIYAQPDDDGPLTSSRLVAIARHATDIASQAREIEHGDILLGVAGTVQLWGQIRLEEPELIAYLMADACRHLPPATRYEIRRRPALTMVEQGIERTTTTTCWVRDPAMDDVARWGEALPGTVVGGYLLLGQYRTPKGPTGP